MRNFARVAVLGLAGVLFVGCGGGGSDSSTSTTSANGGNGFDTAKLQKYTKCLSKHGVDLPNVGNGGAPPNGGSIPDGATPPNGGSIPDGATPPNGGSIPDGATPPSGGGANGGFPGLDQSDPNVKKATKACASLQPQFPGANSGQNPATSPST